MRFDPNAYTHRPYQDGHHDCYGSFRELFMAATGEVLPDFARPNGWWNTELDLIQNQFAQAGFRSTGLTVNGARPLMVLLFAVASDKINHVGLYLGGGKFFHHPFGKPSVIEPLSGAWKARCVGVLQHENHHNHTFANTAEHFQRQPIHVVRKWTRTPH